MAACSFALTPRFEVKGLGFGVWDLGFGVWGLGIYGVVRGALQIRGLGFRDWGLGFRDLWYGEGCPANRDLKLISSSRATSTASPRALRLHKP